MLLSKTVNVSICNANKKYYQSLGFDDIKNGDTIMVNVGDLPVGSHCVVKCSCDYCGEEIDMEYKRYLRSINKTIPKIACKECKGMKFKETSISTYGMPSPMCVKSIQEKARKTTMSHYGVEYPFQSKYIKEKIKKTFIEHYGVEHLSQSLDYQKLRKEELFNTYGVDCILHVPKVAEKVRNTMLQRYGVENISQSDEIKQKKKDTLLANYGVEYGAQSQVIMEKMRKTLYKNKTAPTSLQQEYLCNLYNMTLNYPIKSYSADMCDVENKLICEYDGGGHQLSVKIGFVSEEEFNQKEIIRNNIIKREGYKIFRIISFKDKLPSDDVLLDILQKTKQYFKEYPNHSWIEFNIDNNTVRNAENKQGIPFNFGKTRSIYNNIKEK